jgi:ABC-type transport system involved in Fe-S cluster assembly fused permease/ATPase subunit
MYRTFVKLGSTELDFLRLMQRAHMARFKKKGKPPLSKILRCLILDYRRMLLGQTEVPDLDKLLELKPSTEEILS